MTYYIVKQIYKINSDSTKELMHTDTRLFNDITGDALDKAEETFYDYLKVYVRVLERVY